MGAIVKLWLVYSLIFILLPVLAAAQDGVANQSVFKIHIKKASGEIAVDGKLEETDWAIAEKALNFNKKYPTDEGKSSKPTEVFLTYDKNYIYIAAIVYDSLPYISPTLKRDGQVMESDWVGVVLDPVNQRTNGFFFSVNPYNVQADDMFDMNSDEMSYSWDSKWLSATKHYPDRWTAEMAIPFKSIRYQKDKTTWGINFVRNNRKDFEIDTWAKMPLNFTFTHLGWTGSLIWDTPPPEPGKNISFVPYLKGSVTKTGDINPKFELAGNAGFDAKIALSASLNLDITANPDFSQIEVDKQVTNLTRFSIFLPEKRTFFLENQDLFGSYGIPPIRPFHSRRIGLDADGNVIPIIGGFRLSGNLTKNARVGLMNMQTVRKDQFAAQNYSAASISYKVLKRSLVKAYYIGHEAFLNDEEKKNKPIDKYGRNAGYELVYNNSNGDISGWLGQHVSFKPTVSGKNVFLNFGGGYFGRKLTCFVDYDGVGENYYTDMGFVARINNYDALRDTVIRKGFAQLFNMNRLTLVPKEGKIASHQFILENFYVWNPDKTLNEFSVSPTYRLLFKNSSELRADIVFNTVSLEFPTSFTDGATLPLGRYQFTNYGVGYKSDGRKNFNFALALKSGKFYSGTLKNVFAEINLRKQPKINIGTNFEYNRLDFPNPYGKADLFLVSPKFEWNFSTNLFWTTFLQYNTQANNFGINSRFQYRYKPMSDIFLVYTDNYYSTPVFKNRNRAIVLKINYWLNL